MENNEAFNVSSLYTELYDAKSEFTRYTFHFDSTIKTFEFEDGQDNFIEVSIDANPEISIRLGKAEAALDGLRDAWNRAVSELGSLNNQIVMTGLKKQAGIK